MAFVAISVAGHDHRGEQRFIPIAVQFVAGRAFFDGFDVVGLGVGIALADFGQEGQGVRSSCRQRRLRQG